MRKAIFISVANREFGALRDELSETLSGRFSPGRPPPARRLLGTTTSGGGRSLSTLGTTHLFDPAGGLLAAPTASLHPYFVFDPR